MKPKFANNWYSEVPTQQLRQEVQAVYEKLDELDGREVDLGPVEDSLADLEGSLDDLQADLDDAVQQLNSRVLKSGDTVTGTLSLTPPQGSGSRPLVFNHGYALNVDNVGSGSDNSRVWLESPDGGEVVIGPRSGSARLDNVRVRSRGIRLEGETRVYPDGNSERWRFRDTGDAATTGLMSVGTNYIYTNGGGASAGISAGAASNQAANMRVTPSEGLLRYDADTKVRWHANEVRLYGPVALNDAQSGTSSPVRGDRSIAAGNGLTGGGNLSANRTISLGTPGTITNATTNSVSSTSHTHSLTLPSTANFGVGAYAFLIPASGGSLAHNATRAGSSMRYASIRAMTGGQADITYISSPVPSGTWRNIGTTAGQLSGTTGIPTLCVRTA